MTLCSLRLVKRSSSSVPTSVFGLRVRDVAMRRWVPSLKPPSLAQKPDKTVPGPPPPRAPLAPAPQGSPANPPGVGEDPDRGGQRPGD